MSADDWEDVAEIYKQVLETGNAAFQQDEYIPGIKIHTDLVSGRSGTEKNSEKWMGPGEIRSC